MDTDVVIVGGGLSGLALARELETAGVDYLLLEAQSQLGGRIKSFTHGNSTFDMGPAWFWYEHKKVKAMTETYQLTTFEQYADGMHTYENEQGQVRKGPAYTSMQGSYRIDGGISRLIEAIASGLDGKRLLLNHVVTNIRYEQQLLVTVEGKDTPIRANRLVFAVPPRIVASLGFSPALPEEVINAMQAIPTWMAGHAKVLAIYEQAFWREAGLSGDASSRYGPLVEVHDASDSLCQTPALFGFVGVPPEIRGGEEEALEEATILQLGRLFGEQALHPRAVLIQDWAFEKRISVKEDHQTGGMHLGYRRPASLQALWDQRLYFGSSELANQHGGYLEGALNVAEELAGELLADI